MPVSTQLLMKLMSLDGTTQFAFVTEVGCQQCECCKGHICPSRVTTSCTTSLVASPGHATSPRDTARQNWENGLFQNPHAIPHLEPPYLQAGQEELHVLQEYGFHFPGFLQCFMVILSACLLLNLQDCFLSIPGCLLLIFLHCELCWQSSRGQINGNGTALLLSYEILKLIAYVITRQFL